MINKKIWQKSLMVFTTLVVVAILDLYTESTGVIITPKMAIEIFGYIVVITIATAMIAERIQRPNIS